MLQFALYNKNVCSHISGLVNPDSAAGQIHNLFFRNETSNIQMQSNIENTHQIFTLIICSNVGKIL